MFWKRSVSRVVFWFVGYIHFKDGFKDFFPVEDYLDLFDLAAHNIQREISRNSSGGHRVLQFLTGEHVKVFVCGQV